jgi:hypothetical protein
MAGLIHPMRPVAHSFRRPHTTTMMARDTEPTQTELAGTIRGHSRR